MDISGVSSSCKERLIEEAQMISLPRYTMDNRRLKCVEIFHITMSLICVVACITSSVCAFYCYQTLTGQQAPSVALVTAPIVASTIAPDVTSNTAPDVTMDIDSESDLDNVLYDWDDSEDDEDEYEIEEYDLDESEGSGYLSSEKPESYRRTRRSTDGCEEKCKSNETQRKKIKRCIRKCKGVEKSRSSGDKRKQPSSGLAAAHFEAYYSDDEIEKLVRVDFNTYEMREKCKFISPMEGTLCGNRTFFPQKTDAPLRIFKPASWVQEKTSPVSFNNSVLSVKSTGIYMVYAQANIGGKDSEKSIIIVQKRAGNEIGALSCNNGVHPDHFDSLSPQKQTCSIVGLMHMQERDTLEVQKSVQTSRIALDKDKTYFGLVQISNFAKSERKKGGKKGKQQKQ